MTYFKVYYIDLVFGYSAYVYLAAYFVQPTETCRNFIFYNEDDEIVGSIHEDWVAAIERLEDGQ